MAASGPIEFEKAVAVTGLNLDDDITKLENGEYTNAVNVRVGSSINGKKGLVANIPGVKRIPFPEDGPAGTLTCVAAHFDKTTRNLFFLIYSATSGNHSVLKYDEQSQTIELIYKHENLNFSLDNKITGFTEIDGMLFWCDGVKSTSNPPRQLYWRKAQEPTTGNYSFNQGFDKGSGTQLEEYLMQIKRPPNSVVVPTLTTTSNILGGVSFAASATVITVTTTGDIVNGDIIIGFGIDEGTTIISFIPDTSITISQPTIDISSSTSRYITRHPDAPDNALNRYSYQFSYQYVYWNNEQSVWASVSKLMPMAYPNNFDDNGETIDNAINVHIPVITDLGGSPEGYAKIIRYINIAYREGYNRNYKICKRINFPPTVSIGGILLDSWATPNDGDWSTAEPDPTFSVDSSGDVDFIFSNLSASAVIDNAKTDLPYHAVPLLSQGLELNDGNIFEGNYITGYDNFFLKLSDRLSVNEAVTLNTQILKPGSTYQYGIVGSDKYGRKSLVQSDQLLLINTPIQGTFAPPFNRTGEIADHNYLSFGVDTNLFPAWVYFWQIVRTQNQTVTFWMQARIENAYYITGRDINKNPRFTKQIGGTYNLTTTPSVDYLKTYEDENAYRLSQLYQDNFDYITNKNTSADYSQGTEVWLDISNLTKYKTNAPYIFSQGDRVRLLTLGGSSDDNASVIDDFPIKEVFQNRFLVIDGNQFEFSGIDTVDYGVGNTRLFVAVNNKGEVWFSKDDSPSYYGNPERSCNLGEKLNKVSIRRPATSADVYVVIVGDSGVIYLSQYSLIASNTASAWTKIIPGTPISENITNITSAKDDTRENFFFCGDNGLFGSINVTSATSATVIAHPNAGSGPPVYDISTWMLRGIDVRIPEVAFPGNYWVSMAAYTQQPTGNGGCCVAEIVASSLALETVYTAVGPTISGSYNDCVSFPTDQSNAFFTIVCGGKSGDEENQGGIDAFEYTKNTTPSSRAVTFKGIMDRKESKFGEIIAMSKAYISLLPLDLYEIQPDGGVAKVASSTQNSYLFYCCDVNGNILVRGWYYDSIINKFISILVQYSSVTSTLFPIGILSVNGMPPVTAGFDNLPNAVLNFRDNPRDILPLEAVSKMQGQVKLNDIAITNQGTAVSNYVDGTIRTVGAFFGNGTVFDYGRNGNQNTIIKIDPFQSAQLQSVLNYGALIEIYSPKKSQTDIYYEIGEVFLKDGSIATINLNDRTGDAFVINKSFKGRLWEKNADIVSMSPDADNISGSISNETDTAGDFVPSWNKDIGRAYIVDYDAKQVFYKSGVCFSDKYIQGSKVNGLCAFGLSNYKLYPYEYGSITKLSTISDTGSEGANGIKGNILLVLHENTSSSVYINRNILTNPSGGSQLTQAEEVLGSYNPLVKAQGCIHPESFKQFNSVGIYYNQQKGTIVQYSINGNDLISNNKARVYFYDVSEKIRAYAKANSLEVTDFIITAAFDPFYNEYIISFSRIHVGSSWTNYPDRFTIAYSLSEDRFVTWYEYYPEWMEYLTTTFVSFNKGAFYLHNSGNRFEYNNFYDDDNVIRQRESLIEIPINNMPSQVKQYLSLKEESTIPMKATIVDKEGQQTDLVEADFEFLEGKYYSQLYNNVNTSGFTDPLLTGDNMRSSTIWIKLRSKSNKLINLYSVTLSYIKSLL